MLTTTKVNNSNLVVYVPDGVTSKMRAVVFIPGIGEQNTDVNGLYVHGPLKFIRDGWKPDFIVAGIQPPGQWPSAQWVADMLTALVSAYPVDVTRVTLTGLSAGAATIYGYVNTFKATEWLRPAAVIALSYPNTDITNWRDLPAWGLCGDADAVVSFAGQAGFWKAMQDAGYKDKPWTTMKGYGHYNWNDFYNPTYKDPALAMNFYDWAKQFKLAVTPALTNVVVAVAPTPPAAVAIGLIEAEKWSAMSGVQTENAYGDSTGGGLNVAYIDKDDYIEYLLDVPASGAYTLGLRLASPNNNSQFAVSIDGARVMTVDVPNTGGYQVWRTVEVPVPLTKGARLLRFTSTRSEAWNINYFNIAVSNASGHKLKSIINVYDDGFTEIKNV